MNIIDIYVGSSEKVIDKKNKEFKSSYRKQAIKGDIFVNKLGLEGDTQTDTKRHGGVDKAICVFPKGNYEYLKDKYNLNLSSCAFGENITLEDVSDKDICLGDIYSCGEVLLEVTQPRQPCWKISSVIGIENLTKHVLDEYKTGFYLRVLKEGKINKKCEFKLEKREHEEINIEFINKAYSNSEIENIKKILLCPQLSEGYRETLEKRLKKFS